MEMLDGTHRRTIQALSLTCPKEGVGKHSFLLSIASLPSGTLPRQVLQCRLRESYTNSWIPLLEPQINDLNLPNIAMLIQNTPPRAVGKGAAKRSAPGEPSRGQEQLGILLLTLVCSTALPKVFSRHLQVYQCIRTH